MKRLTIAILNWNGADMLRTFLPSVIRYSSLDWVDICVADNGSTDDSVSVVLKEFPSVNIIKLEKNYGFAEGYNRVVEMLDTEYVVLLNSDVEVSEGWLNPIVEFMDNNHDVAACQPKILSYKDKSVFEYAGAAGGYIDKYGYPFCRGRIFDTLEKDEGQYDSVAEIFWASGAAMFVRREAYIKAGGLDSGFFAHMEEIDLCWRLKSRGFKIMCIPQSKVYHVGGATLKKENPRKTYLNFRNNLLMLYKNLTESELNKVMLMRTMLDYVAILVFLFKFDMANAKAVISARRDYKSMRNSYVSARTINIIEAKNERPLGKADYSIIWKNKVSRCRKFSDL